MKRRLFLGAAGAAASEFALGEARAATVQVPDSQRAQAWVGATVVDGTARAPSQATVVVQGERIVEVLAGASAPEGLTLHRAEGLVLTPGWIACGTALGLVEVEYEASTVDSSAGDVSASERVRAAHRTADGFNPNSSLLGVAQRGGITNAIPTPVGGLVSGQSCWVDVVPHGLERSIVQEQLALHADVFSDQWGSRPRGLSLLREALESARLYARSPAAYDRGQTRALSIAPVHLASLAECFDGRPLVVRVSRAADMVRLLKVAEEFSLRLILSGAQEAYLVAPQLADRGVSVIINPLDNLPTSFGELYSHRRNVAVLQAAGVRICLSTFDAHQIHNLSQLAGNCVGAGITQQQAVAALTVNPAAAFGMAGDYGTVQPGKIANFCLWTGDPLETSSWVETLVIRGVSCRPRCRQDELFDRYKNLSSVPRGRRELLRDLAGS